MTVGRHIKEIVHKEKRTKKININDYKYFDVLIIKIVGAVTNQYSKVAKSDIQIFVEAGDMDNNTEEKTIGIYKIKRFDSYFYYF